MEKSDAEARTMSVNKKDEVGRHSKWNCKLASVATVIATLVASATATASVTLDSIISRAKSEVVANSTIANDLPDQIVLIPAYDNATMMTGHASHASHASHVSHYSGS